MQVNKVSLYVCFYKIPFLSLFPMFFFLFSNIIIYLSVVEGYMKTDDRMRLAKERREERERSLVGREQLIREKERRARLQYERTVEERWRRLDEQRQKEEHRRAAVEEKRRQQLEDDRERLEALMKRSLERSLQLEQRTKRWSRGCPSGAGTEKLTTEVPTHSQYPSVTLRFDKNGVCHHVAPCSPHRSPFRGSLNPADHNRVGLQGGSQSTPNTPKVRPHTCERLRRERRTASPGCGSPLRRSESPASVPRHLASPATSNNTHQYYYSPTRQRSNRSPDHRKPDDKTPDRHSEQSKAVRKNTDINSTNPSSQEMKSVVNESAPCASAGKVAAGTTNAEEATRLLAERRRQARAQKELEEKKREQEEEDQEEQLKKQLAQERRQQEAKTQQLKEKGKHQEDLNRLKQEEDKRKKEEQEKLLQISLSFCVNCALNIRRTVKALIEELISIPEFSPVNEIQHSSVSNTRALEDLIDLTGSIAYPKMSSEGNVGNCNKNLLGGVVSPMVDSKLIGMLSPSSNKLSIQ
uniref:Uncharacterized protein n=1 Tax=Cyclopterus lumpus TaxID=8103 RepID=A0A8C2ZVZ1_CYCLU